MKKLIAIAATTAMVAMAGTAMAATQGSLAVSANVTASCSIVGGALSFGSLDAVSAPVVNANAAGVTVTCTNGQTYNVTRNDGANSPGAGALRLSDGGGNYITYTMTTFPIAGTGNGAAQTITIAGNIPAGSYAGAAQGAYADTVVLTVGP